MDDAVIRFPGLSSTRAPVPLDVHLRALEGALEYLEDQHPEMAGGPLWARLQSAWRNAQVGRP